MTMSEKIVQQQEEFESGEGHITDVSTGSGRVRKRIKVRKKVRVRKKSDPKKKLKKIAERAFWFLVVVGFLFALITMFVELDIKDDKYKKTQKATPITRPN